jgi:PIN domain nuclease of toxin-antitoxin system
MTIRVIADTHAILWYLFDDSRLSKTAGDLLDAIVADADQIALSAMTLAEVVYLIERGRIDAIAFDRIFTELNQTDATLVEIPLDRFVIQAMQQVDPAIVPELPDRLILATVLYLGVPIISRDHKIRAASPTTIWE